MSATEIRICQRPTCGRPITGNGKLYCGQRCAGLMAPKWGHTPKAERAHKAPTSSWWADKPEEFYTEARKRFPEAGTGQVSRSKVFTRGTDAPGFKARVRQAQERKLA